MFDYPYLTKDELVRTFYSQKFEAFGISIFALIIWLSSKDGASGTDWSLLLSRDSLSYLAIFLLGYSSWRLNQHAESACIFETCYAIYYAGHAAIQDFFLFGCVGAIGLCVLYNMVNLTWFIVGCVIVFVVMLWKYKSMLKIFQWITYAKDLARNNMLSQTTEVSLQNFLCMLIRYFAIGYTIYFIITN